MYKIEDNTNKELAKKLVEEYDYNSKAGRLPLGVLYQTKQPSLQEKWPQLKTLKEKSLTWQEKKKVTFEQSKPAQKPAVKTDAKTVKPATPARTVMKEPTKE